MLSGDGPFKSGQILSASALNRLAGRQARATTGTAFQQTSGGDDPDIIGANPPDIIFIKLTAKTGTTPIKYSWKEVKRTASGTWADASRTGTNTNSDLAIELNNTDLSVTDGYVYMAQRSPQSGEWLFFLRRKSFVGVSIKLTAAPGSFTGPADSCSATYYSQYDETCSPILFCYSYTYNGQTISLGCESLITGMPAVVPQPSSANPVTITVTVSSATTGPFYGTTTYPASQPTSIGGEGTWTGIKTLWTPQSSYSQTFTSSWATNQTVGITIPGTYSFTAKKPLTPPSTITLNIPTLTGGTPLAAVAGHDQSAATTAFANFPTLTLTGSSTLCRSSSSYTDSSGSGTTGPTFSIPNGTYTKSNGKQIPIYGGTFRIVRGADHAFLSVTGQRVQSAIDSCFNDPHWKTTWSAGGAYYVSFRVDQISNNVPATPPAEYCAVGLNISTSETPTSDFAGTDTYNAPVGALALQVAYSGSTVSAQTAFSATNQWTIS